MVELTKLKVDGDFAQISWGIKILEVEYDKPNITLTYKNCNGQKNRVFAVCTDICNFDKEKVLEKALLKAFQNEIINISSVKNNGQDLHSKGAYTVLVKSRFEHNGVGF